MWIVDFVFDEKHDPTVIKKKREQDLDEELGRAARNRVNNGQGGQRVRVLDERGKGKKGRRARSKQREVVG